MKQVVTCPICSSQSWQIYQDRLVCCQCREEYPVHFEGFAVIVCDVHDHYSDYLKDEQANRK